jgi:transcriptional regulator with XRE-family HTH domain
MIGAPLVNSGARRRSARAVRALLGTPYDLSGTTRLPFGNESIDDGLELRDLGVRLATPGRERVTLMARVAQLTSPLVSLDAIHVDLPASHRDIGANHGPNTFDTASRESTSRRRNAIFVTNLSLPGITCANIEPMPPTRRAQLFLFDARRALRMTQAEFAAAVKGSHRTTVRWEAGQSTPAPAHFITLAELLYPIDRTLAAEAAAHAGQTLVSLKLEAPPAPPPAPPPPAPPPLPRPTAKREDLVDILILAGVRETRGSVEDVRRWIYAVMKRACDVGLTVEDAERALRPGVGE